MIRGMSILWEICSRRIHACFGALIPSSGDYQYAKEKFEKACEIRGEDNRANNDDQQEIDCATFKNNLGLAHRRLGMKEVASARRSLDYGGKDNSRQPYLGIRKLMISG